MAKTMKIITIAFAFLFASFLMLYHSFKNTIFLSFCITFGTCFYHFIMRLTVGLCINKIINNKVDYSKPWFKVSKFELKLYKFLKLKKLKKIPTYSPSSFSTELHSFEEIVQASCQAEIVHEIIFILSYIPILFTFLFGEFYVFLFTSVFASLIDLFFVIVQRCKRPTLIRFIKKHHKNI